LATTPPDDFDNPLFDYLIEHQNVPRGCVEPWLVYFLGMTSLFSAVLAILYFDRGFPAGFDNGDVIWYVFRIMWPPALIMPIITAFVGAIMTVRTVRQSTYELIVVSGLSDQKIVQAFIFATWFWLRSWMTWQVGFAPLLIAGLINLNAKFHVESSALILIPVLLTIGLAATIYLTLTVAVALGLRWQEWTLAALVAIVVALIAILGLILVILTPSGLVIPQAAFSTTRWIITAFIVTTLIIGCGLSMEWMAQFWVRHSLD
jgi:hypothetical protein